MRLQEVYHICSNAKNNWSTLSFDEAKAAGGISYFKIQNPTAIRNTLASLDTVDALAESIASIRNKALGFTQTSGEITIDSRTKSSLVAEYQSLENKLNTIVDLFDSLDYRQDSDGFDIKLPPDISLTNLSKCTKDLDTIFSTCPLFTHQQGTINFTAVDVGSVWLSFVVIGTAAVGMLKLFAELVDKALIIRSHYLTTKKQEEQIRSLHLGNELLESSVELNKGIRKGLLDKACAELAETHSITDPEDNERLRNSIQLLSEWMNKGMEVYASIASAPEVKAVFPAMEAQSLPENIIALLTDENPPSE